MKRYNPINDWLDANLATLINIPVDNVGTCRGDIRYHEAGHTIVGKYTRDENKPRETLAWRDADGRVMGLSTEGDASRLIPYKDPVEVYQAHHAALKNLTDWDRPMVTHLSLLAAGYAAEIINAAAWHKFGPRTRKICWLYADERQARAVAQMVDGGSFERYALAAFMLAGDVLYRHWREVVELAEAVYIQPAPSNVISYFDSIDTVLRSSIPT